MTVIDTLESKKPPSIPYMSGGLCGHHHVAGVTSSDRVMESIQTGRNEPKKSFDRDWKEIRQRLERKLAAAAAQAISGRPGGGDSRSKPRWATPPKQKETRFYQVPMEDKLTKRGANPRTGVVSPSNRTDSSAEDPPPCPRLDQKWKVKGDQWVTVDATQTPSPRGSPLSYELTKTVSSSGSGTTGEFLSEDWEDRFVVNMPSAHDPDPPSMTAEQIRLYQENMGNIHGAPGSRHEMDASKSSSGSPEPKLTKQSLKMSSIPLLQKGTTINSLCSSGSESISPTLDGPRQYFSPDEVGQARVSPVNDIPKLTQKELFKKLKEECFLGCLGVDEAGAKNPDEILLFPNSDDENDRQSLCATNSDTKGGSGMSAASLDSAKGTRLLNNGHTLSRSNQKKVKANLRPIPLAIPPSLTPASKIPVHSNAKTFQKSGRMQEKSGDTSLNSPTGFASASSKAKPEDVRTHHVQNESSQTSYAKVKSARSTPENNCFFDSSSPDLTDGNHHSPAESLQAASPDSSWNVTGIKMSTYVQESCTGHVNGGDQAGIRDEAPSSIHFAASKAGHVVELDGVQVPHQLPSPPLSCSPSPRPSKPEAKGTSRSLNSRINETRDSHTIRMEIRLKAEKARQGAAAAKTASERLAAARQHAERLAEARAAYDKAKSQKVANKVKEQPGDLEQRRLNTEKINEARKAYKAAKAKEEAEKLAVAQAAHVARQAEKHATKVKEEEEKIAALHAARQAKKHTESRHRESKAKPSSSSSSSSTKAKSSTVPVNETREPRKTARNREATRPAARSETNIQPDAATSEFTPAAKSADIPNEDLVTDDVLSFGVLCLSFNKLYDFLNDYEIYSQMLSQGERLFQMACHCFKVCRCLAEAWLEYKRTGSVSQSCGGDDAGQILGNIGQATINLAVFFCVFMFVMKVIGYVLIAINWIAWLCRPLGWVLGNLFSALVG